MTQTEYNYINVLFTKQLKKNCSTCGMTSDGIPVCTWNGEISTNFTCEKWYPRTKENSDDRSQLSADRISR